MESIMTTDWSGNNPQNSVWTITST